MKIPTQVCLLGYTLKVKIIAEDDWPHEDAVGIFYPDKQEIQIVRATPDMMGHAYLHELTHAILNAMSEDRLYKNERFVDTFSGLLHQALCTAR